MLLPFNVERPVRRTPVCTYALIGINVFIYLLTILVANVQLASERDTHRKQMSALIELKMYEQEQAYNSAQPANADPPSGDPSGGSSAEPSSNGFSFLRQRLFQQRYEEGAHNAVGARNATSIRSQIADTPSGELPGSNAPGSGNVDDFYTAPSAPTAETIELARVLKAANSGGKVTKDELVQAMTFEWDQQHDRDMFVLDPHPTTLAWLAYWVGAPTMLGFFASMFLHGSLDHILGNMLFLWVFGRALEDALGPLIYLLAYFVCGVAATMLFHIATTQFTPAQAMSPSLGASGAIAGLLGLFAPRFYRTPIKVFYTKWVTQFFFLSGGAIYWLSTIFVGLMLYRIVGSAGFSIGGLIVLWCFVAWGEDMLWGEWKVQAAWGIAGWFLWNDVKPMMTEAYLQIPGDGTAHWAHLGGFACGVAYAFLVGLTGEGKTEYITDEAETSLELNHGGNALESAQQLLAMKPNDAQAHRLMARALDSKNKGTATEEALDAWEKAIEKYLQAGDRDGAARAYLEATTKHRGFILTPRTQFLLGTHMVRMGDHLGAAETLVKIPYTFPDAPEGELSLLRSAQLYAQHLNNPKMAHQLLTTLLKRYPQTEWKAQVESGLKNTQAQLQSVDKV